MRVVEWEAIATRPRTPGLRGKRANVATNSATNATRSPTPVGSWPLEGRRRRLLHRPASELRRVPAHDILHDWDDEDASRILAAVAKSGERGAAVLVIETVMPEGPDPHWSMTLDVLA